MSNQFVQIPLAPASVDVSALGALKTIIAGGNFNGIVTVEASADGVSFGPAFNFQAAGVKTLPISATKLRFTRTGGGTVSLWVGSGVVGSHAAVLPVTAGNGTGAAVDVSNLGSQRTLVIVGPFTGTIEVQVSDDSNFSPLPNASFQSGVVITIPHYAKQCRIKRSNVNGGPLPMVAVVASNDDDNTSAPWNPQYITIYARLTGSDTTGTGTLANPYRTFQRAILDVPVYIPSGLNYFVDITGIGVETLPDNYCLPTFKSGDALIFDVSSSPYWNTTAAVNITADPQLVTSGLNPAGGAVISMGEVLPGLAGQDQDPVTGLSFIKLKPAAAAAKAWVPGALKGKLLSGSGGPFEQAVIYDNTADTIYFTLTYNVTFPAKIMECSAGLKSTATIFSYGVFPQVNYCDLIAFRSIFFPEGVSTRGGSPIFDFCDVVDLDSSAPGYAANMWQSHFHNGAVGTFIQAAVYANNSFLDGLTTFYGAWAFSPANTQSVVFYCAIIGCDPSGLVLDNSAIGGVLTSGMWLFYRSLIRSAVSHGIEFRGGNMVVARLQIEGSGGDAIKASQGGGFVDLFEVHGAGNGGRGLTSTDGIVVRADDATDVEGAGGPAVAVKVGDQAAAPWPAVGIQIADPAVSGPVGASGTDSRLYIVP